MPDGSAPRLGRRVMVVRLGALAGASTLTGCVVAPPGPVVVPAGRVRTGLSDADPSDGPGYGRGGRPVQGRAYTGISDSDPSDGPGHGRGRPGPVGRPYTGLSDADPSDGPGHGRGGYRGARGVTDSDPSDGPGRGRGWR